MQYDEFVNLLMANGMPKQQARSTSILKALAIVNGDTSIMQLDGLEKDIERLSKRKADLEERVNNLTEEYKSISSKIDGVKERIYQECDLISKNIAVQKQSIRDITSEFETAEGRDAYRMFKYTGLIKKFDAYTFNPREEARKLLEDREKKVKKLGDLERGWRF